MKNYKKFATGFLLGVAVVVSVAFKKDYFEITRQLEIFSGLFKEINLYYVDKTSPKELMNSAITNMLEDLDPYTVFMDESEVEEFKIQTTGEYGGIGSTIRQIDSAIYIAEPYEGGPAFKSGLKAGDKILNINGVSLDGKSSSDVSELLKGTPGTGLSLEVDRYGVESSINFSIEREQIMVDAVPFYEMLDEEVGYIYLTSFTERSAREVKDAFADLKSQGMKSLVFDLRSNPGGLLRQAVDICNIFVAKDQEIVSTRGKVEEWDQVYHTTNDPLDRDIPLVVLVNSGSASASEIVTGTMQDLDRGVVMGQRTFGKGLVQQPRQLSYGTQVKITTAKYYTPSGRCIQAIDYSHRSDDGSVSKVPDSLKTAFKTKNGRTVYDGGGVEPDVHLKDKEYSDVVRQLFFGSELFTYANKFVTESKSIATPENFEISDAIFEDFKAYLKDVDFDYNTASERQLEKLRKAVASDEFGGGINNEIEKLEALIDTEKAIALDKYRKEITYFLSEELVTRYYHKKGRLKYRVSHDDEIKEAVALLKDRKRYEDLLKP